MVAVGGVVVALWTGVGAVLIATLAIVIPLALTSLAMRKDQ